MNRYCGRLLKKFFSWLFDFSLKSVPDSYIPASSRSPLWNRVRNSHIKRQGKCQLCGGTDDLEVHHIVPFHIDPDKELDPNNLITLCGSGKGGVNCHLFFGHLGNWKKCNTTVVIDCLEWSKKIKEA